MLFALMLFILGMTGGAEGQELRLTPMMYFQPGMSDSELLTEYFDRAELREEEGIVLDWSSPPDGWWDLNQPVTVKCPVKSCVQRPGPVRNTAAIPYALRLETDEAYYEGPIHVDGMGGTIYTTRTLGKGVVLGTVSETTFVGGIRVRDTLSHGVWADPTGSIVGTDFRRVYVTDCGSSPVSPSGDLVLDFTSVRHEGAASTQRSFLTIADIPDELEPGSLVIQDDKVHYVYSNGNGELEVYPQLADLTLTSGSITSMHGAALAVEGGNTAMHTAKVVSQRCGEAYGSRGLYGGHVLVLSQADGTVFRIANVPNSAHRGGFFRAHIEIGTKYHAVGVNRQGYPGLVVAGVNLFDTVKWVPVDPLGPNFAGVTVLFGGTAEDGAAIP